MPKQTSSKELLNSSLGLRSLSPRFKPKSAKRFEEGSFLFISFEGSSPLWRFVWIIPFSIPKRDVWLVEQHFLVNTYLNHACCYYHSVQQHHLYHQSCWKPSSSQSTDKRAEFPSFQSNNSVFLQFAVPTSFRPTNEPAAHAPSTVQHVLPENIIIKAHQIKSNATYER